MPFVFSSDNESPLSALVSGDGIPSFSQPVQPGEENSNSSTELPPRVPEPPDLADKSSQSSMASFDDTGMDNSITSHVTLVKILLSKPPRPI